MYTLVRNSVGIIAMCGFVYYFGRQINIRLRKNRVAQEQNALSAMDRRNMIEGAPPKVRHLTDGMEKEPVTIDDHMCTSCRIKKCSIVNLPCKHCYSCEDCYKEEGDKNRC